MFLFSYSLFFCRFGVEKVIIMKRIFDIKGMHCPSCEMLIKEVLEETAGVTKADVSKESGIAIVFFDSSKVSERELKKLIKDNGYEVQ